MFGPSEPTFIEVEKLKRMQMLHVRFLIFDLRDAVSFQKSHIQSAFHIETQDFLEKIQQLVPAKDTPVVVYDEDGHGIGELVLQAEKYGYLNIVILEGGY